MRHAASFVKKEQIMKNFKYTVHVALATKAHFTRVLIKATG